jgi:hypothetical protein
MTTLTLLARPPKGGYPPNVLIHPDGRIQLNVGVVQFIWGRGNPHAKRDEKGREVPTVPGTLYLRMYARGSTRPGARADSLVLVRAERGEPGAITANPVGRRDVHWPVVYVARAAAIMRALGIYGQVRLPAREITVETEDGRVVQAALVDLRNPMEGSLDDVGRCLRIWLEGAKPGQVVSRDEFLAQLREVASKEGVPLLRRQVEDYVIVHRDDLFRMGLEFVPSSKITFREVRVLKRPQ